MCLLSHLSRNRARRHRFSRFERFTITFAAENETCYRRMRNRFLEKNIFSGLERARGVFSFSTVQKNRHRRKFTLSPKCTIVIGYFWKRISLSLSLPFNKKPRFVSFSVSFYQSNPCRLFHFLKRVSLLLLFFLFLFLSFSFDKKLCFISLSVSLHEDNPYRLPHFLKRISLSLSYMLSFDKNPSLVSCLFPSLFTRSVVFLFFSHSLYRALLYSDWAIANHRFVSITSLMTLIAHWLINHFSSTWSLSISTQYARTKALIKTQLL